MAEKGRSVKNLIGQTHQSRQAFHRLDSSLPWSAIIYHTGFVCLYGLRLRLWWILSCERMCLRARGAENQQENHWIESMSASCEVKPGCGEKDVTGRESDLRFKTWTQSWVENKSQTSTLFSTHSNKKMRFLKKYIISSRSFYYDV